MKNNTFFNIPKSFIFSPLLLTKSDAQKKYDSLGKGRTDQINSSCSAHLTVAEARADILCCQYLTQDN